MSERMTTAEYLAMQSKAATGATRKNKSIEGDLSKAISDDLSFRLRVPNDRLQSGRLKIVKESVTKKGEKRRYENWMQFCQQGTPDRFFIHGFAVFLEVKTKGEISSPEQIAKQQELRAAGAIVVEVDSYEKYAKVIATLERFTVEINRLKHVADIINWKIAKSFET